MRKILFPIVLVITFLSCTKNELGNLKYVNTIQGGCALDKGSSFKQEPLYKSDTLTYSVTKDSLNIFVGFNATCCSEYSSSSLIVGDSIIIKIPTTQVGLCNCICYYIYNFKYSGNGNFYKYHVSGSNLNFKGLIKN
jgi:hypothetical protein